MANGHVTFVLSDGRSHSAAVRRSARSRRIALRLQDDGNLLLTVPTHTPRQVVEESLPHFVPWLEKRLAKLHVAPMALPDTLALNFTGQEFQIRYGGDYAEGRRLAARSRSCLQVRNGTMAQRLLLLELDTELRFFASAGMWEKEDLPEQMMPLVAKALQRFCRARAEAVLPPFLQHVARQHGFTLADIRIHDQHSRWASCARIRTGGHRVNLNWRGIFLPVELFTHLCCHELCHTRHMDHSPRFHAALEAISPHARNLERSLNEAWRSLPRWSRVRLAKQED